MNMAKVREQYWVPRLRQLTRKVIKSCYGCRRFQANAVQQPPPGLLPQDRTTGSRPFEAISVDFAGPIKYVKRRKDEGKAYVLLYGCSLTRAVYLELMPSLDTTKFIERFKQFIKCNTMKKINLCMATITTRLILYMNYYSRFTQFGVLVSVP